MNRYKKLASDTFLMALGNFASRTLVFFLLPLYTYVLTAEEYGIADLFTTTTSLLIPILTVAISESTFRYAFDVNLDQNKNLMCSFLILGSSIIFIIPVTYLLGLWNSVFWGYPYLFIFLFLSNAFNLCLVNYSRGTDHIRIFVWSGIIYTITLTLLNILFLLFLSMGLVGYLVAAIAAFSASSLYVFVSLKGWRVLKLQYIDFSLLKEMLRYSTPMVFSTTAWWVMNSIDKYMLIDYFGLNISGLYGVAQKIPTILTVISSVFIQAWQISAISVHGEKDSSEFYTNVYNVYETLLYIIAGILIVSVKPLSSVLFQKEYYEAYVFTPFLILSSIFACLSSFLQSSFIAAKRSDMLLYSTLLGALCNIIANIFLMVKFGPVGAAIATFIGFSITWLLRYFSSLKYEKITKNWFTSAANILLLSSQAILITYNVKYNMIYACSLLCVLLLLNNKIVKSLSLIILKRLKNVSI